MLAVAYGVGAPSLGVAEFSPSAQQTLESPPSTDNALAGAAGGRRRASTTTAPANTAPASSVEVDPSGPPTSKVGRSRQCVGDPPRQTEDPMSPPCVATMFEGDNGGATSTGVNATEIRIAVPGDTGVKPVVDALFEYFNRHFEFYGRKMVPVYVPANLSDAPSNRATAANIAAEGVFGAATGRIEWGNPPQEAFYLELARNKIITVLGGSGMFVSDRTMYDPLHPYLWSVFPSVEDLSRNMASFACASLVGRPAKHSVDANLKQTTRKFGVISRGKIDAPNTRTLTEALKACDAEVMSVELAKPTGDSIKTAMIRFRDAGVTTMYCLCESYDAYSTVSSATNEKFKPEWMVMSTSSPDEEVDWPYFLNGNASMFGINEQPMVIPYQAEMWFRAFTEIDPKLLATQSDLTWNGFGGRATYASLLVLASGIQLAGPTLTPETFAAGLMTAQFPNPGAGAPPYGQPSAGFGAGDHSFFDDYAIVWWNTALDPLRPYDGQRGGIGTWCYLDRGARYNGTFPTNLDDRFFDASQSCR